MSKTILRDWKCFLVWGSIFECVWCVGYLLMLTSLHATLSGWALLLYYVNPVSLAILTTGIYLLFKDR